MSAGFFKAKQKVRKALEHFENTVFGEPVFTASELEKLSKFITEEVIKTHRTASGKSEIFLDQRDG